MKRILVTISVLGLLAGLTGCSCSHFFRLPRCIFGGSADCESCGSADCESCGDADCQSCGDAGCQSCGQPACDSCGGAPEAFTPGPPAAAVTYPYYTNRGPRDFLAENPPSIGP